METTLLDDFGKLQRPMQRAAMGQHPLGFGLQRADVAECSGTEIGRTRLDLGVSQTGAAPGIGQDMQLPGTSLSFLKQCSLGCDVLRRLAGQSLKSGA